MSLKISIMPGVSGAAASAGGDAEHGASGVGLDTPFPTQQPQKHQRFSNHNEALDGQGYNSESEQLFYDPVALDKDVDKFIEDAIKSTSPPMTAAPTPAPTPAPVAVRILTVDMISSLKVKDLKAELQKRGRGVTGNNTQAGNMMPILYLYLSALVPTILG